MSRIISKKRALLTAAIASLALVAVAIAYYSTLGDGQGTGTARDGYAENLDIVGNVANNLVPGHTVAVTGGKISNPNEGAAKFGAISGKVVAGAPDGEDGIPEAGDCKDGWFHVVDVAESDEDNVIEEAGEVSFTANVTMDDSVTENQNDCKGASLSISWSSL